MKKGLQDVEEDVRSGLSFSDAAAKYPKVFPALFVNMIRAGEATGNLDESLERLAFSYEKQFNLKKKVQSTMAYPIILLVYDCNCCCIFNADDCTSICYDVR